MAFPTLTAQNPTADSSTGGAAISGSTAATSHNVGLPATVNANDLLLVFGRVTVTGTVAITGGGWTIVQDSSDASNDVTFWAYKNIFAIGNEDGTSITVTHGSGKMVAHTMAIAGAENPATQPPQSSTVAIGASTTPNPTTCTPTGGAKDYLWIWFGSWEGEQTLSKTTPTNYTDQPDISTGTGGTVDTNCQLKTARRALNAASEDPGSVTISVSDQWTAWCIAVHPFTAPPPVTGTVAVTQADQTSAAAGSEGTSGTVAVTQADQTCEASGFREPPPFAGDVASIQADNHTASVLTLPGTSGNYANTPDHTSLDITGDIDISADVAPDDWTPAANQTFVSKAAGSNWGYHFGLRTTGVLRLTWSVAGTTTVAIDSTVGTGAANGARLAVRVTFDVDNGSNQRVAIFYTAPSIDGPWTQLGSTVTQSTATSIFNSSRPLEIGAYNNGTLDRLPGRVYAVVVRNGINGTVVANPRFIDQADGATSFVDSTGKTFTIIGSAAIDGLGQGTSTPLSITGTLAVTQANNRTPASLCLPGISGSFASTPDHTSLDIVGDIEVGIDVALDDWVPVANQTFVAKAAGGGVWAYHFGVRTNGIIRLTWSADGTTTSAMDSTVAPTVTDGARLAVVVVFDVNNGASGRTARFYTAPSREGPWTQLGTDRTTAGTASIFSSSQKLVIGTWSSETTEMLSGKVFAAWVRDGIGGGLVDVPGKGTLVAGPSFIDEADGATSLIDSSGKTWSTLGGARITGLAIGEVTSLAGAMAVVQGGDTMAASGSLDIVITPSVIDAAAVMQQPTVAPSAVTISPNVINAAATVQTPTVLAITTITPNVINASATTQAPAVLPGAVTLSPNSITVSTTLNQPTVLPGAVTLTPNVIDATATMQSPTIESAGMISPSVINSAATMQQPTLTTTYSITTNVINAAATAQTPTVLTITTIAPNVINAAASMQQPTIVIGPVSVTPNVINAAPSVGQPLVSLAQTASMGHINAAAVVQSPVIAAGAVTLTPSAISAASTLQQPTIANVITPNVISVATTMQQPTVLRGQVVVSPAVIDASVTPQQPTVAHETPKQIAPNVINASVATQQPVVVPGQITVTPNAISASATIHAINVLQFVAPAAINAAVTLQNPSILPGQIAILATLIQAPVTIFEPIVSNFAADANPASIDFVSPDYSVEFTTPIYSSSGIEGSGEASYAEADNSVSFSAEYSISGSTPSYEVSYTEG